MSNKRVAWFTGQASSSAVTPYKVYDVFNEDGDSFNLKDDKGGTRLCLKKGCAHICCGNWVLADIVGVVEEANTKPKKWGKWIPNTTGKCPEGLKRKQKIKLRWSDGDKFVFDNPHDAACYFSEDASNITHYKVRLKEESKWTKNKGVNPLNTDAYVKIVRRDSGKVVMKARYCDWSLSGHSYDIIKWRLAD